MTVDPLTSWWVHEVQVQRYVGADAYSTPEYAAAVTVPCFIRQQTETVRGPDGVDHVERTDIAYPITVDRIPQQSLITLPPEFGGQAGTVRTSTRADGGGLPTPDHQTVSL